MPETRKLIELPAQGPFWDCQIVRGDELQCTEWHPGKHVWSALSEAWHVGGQMGWGAGLKRSSAHRDVQTWLTIGAIKGQQRFNVPVHACVLQ